MTVKEQPTAQPTDLILTLYVKFVRTPVVVIPRRPLVGCSLSQTLRSRLARSQTHGKTDKFTRDAGALSTLGPRKRIWI